MASRAVLVTGGAGYVGSHACKALARAGYLPVVLDNLQRGQGSAVRFGPLIEADVGDSATVSAALREYAPCGVIHFAAFAYVGESVQAPGMYWRNNVEQGIRLLSAISDYGRIPVLISSSCATYGIPEAIPVAEQAPQRPINPYGESKLALERCLQDFTRASALNGLSLRYFNAAGADPDGELGEVHEPEPHLIPRAMLAAAGKLEALDVYGNDWPTADGSCIRDYVHVHDLALAHRVALECLLAGKTLAPAYNLGTGKGHSVFEVIHAVERVSGRSVPYRVSKRRDGDPAILVANPDAARTELGFECSRSDLGSIVADAWRFHCDHWGLRDSHV